MGNFIFEDSSLDNVIQITPKINIGTKDIFIKNFEINTFAEHGINFTATETYLIREDKLIFRGIHFQDQKPQKRILTVLSGEAYITVVDLDRNSPELGKYETFHLTQEEPRLIFVPEWFGVATISVQNNTTISVMNSGPYYEQYSTGIRYNDATLNIPWPVQNFQVSDKDRRLKSLNEYLHS
ncbi:MAG: dTDP-4-keto-6-deoxy-D-glucose epimerase [Lachnospiraceae bacterium]|nr:dTDP-4-keto-6-deoxy-D-glucose epimerase [Lachnospiraceae bacterium]